MIMKVESIAKQQASGFFHDYRVRPHLEMKRANIVRLGTIKMKRVCRIALDVFQDSINMNRVVKKCAKCSSGRKFNRTFNSSIQVGISALNCAACDKGQYQREEVSTFCLPCLTGTL